MRNSWRLRLGGKQSFALFWGGLLTVPLHRPWASLRVIVLHKSALTLSAGLVPNGTNFKLEHERQGASAANGKYGSMKERFYRCDADCLFCNDRKALPLFDVCFLTTSTSKGRAMSGKAAKVFFNRDNVQHLEQVM